MFGAPVLMYRNVESYTPFDADPMNMDAESFIEHRTLLDRSYARWYWPMDYQTIRPVLSKLPAGFAVEPVNGANEPSSKRHATGRKGEPNSDSDVERRLIKDQTLVFQQEVRAHMLLPDPDWSDDPIEMNKRLSILKYFQQYDVNCLPQDVLEKAHNHSLDCDDGGESDSHNDVVSSLMSSFVDRHRLDKAHSSYLAPFERATVEEITREDIASQFPAAYIPEPNVSAAAEGFKLKGIHRQNVYFGNVDSTDFPARFGNCLVVGACPCNCCRRNDNHSWYLLHATGPLLDKICCSYLRFPEDESWTSRATYLDIDDSLRQLEECGNDTIIARTTMHCTIFRVSVDQSASHCPRQAMMIQLYRIDERSYSKTIPSLRPVDLAGHPKYGTGWTDSNIAVLYEADGQDCKTIKHLKAGSLLRETSHYISNLQSISKIEFSSHHPMVIWSAASSHVRPALTESQTSTRHPRSGNGYSLYSIDLRSNLASFQWSPSAEEYRVEGTHSVSGLSTDWNMPHTLFASSISCGKVWEIDIRMPCRAITSWSLPPTCDDTDTVILPTGMYSCGSIMTQPKFGWTCQEGIPLPNPLLMTNQSPHAARVHLYQRGNSGARCQTPNLEISACSTLIPLDDAHIALSSAYPLPDFAENVFPCGLAAICVPLNRVLAAGRIPQLPTNGSQFAFCLISSTNKGDVYSHVLVEATYYKRSIMNQSNVPSSSGRALLSPLPISLSSQHEIRSDSGGGGEAYSTGSGIDDGLALTNQYPCPAGPILPTFDERSPLAVSSSAMVLKEPRSVEAGPTMLPLICGPTVLTTGKQWRNKSNTSKQVLLNRGPVLTVRDSFQSFDHLVPHDKTQPSDIPKTDVPDELVMKVLTAWPEFQDDYD
jgi:hypothetical protein